MQKKFYFLSPVEVVKVTPHNLEEVAKWCGGKVAQTESRLVPGRMDSYVWVPTPKGNNVSWAFPGMFITKRLVVNVKNELRATWAVFRRDYFEKNYFDAPIDAVDATWEREAREKKPAKVEVKVSVADAMSDAILHSKELTDEIQETVEEKIANHQKAVEAGARKGTPADLKEVVEKTGAKSESAAG